MIEYMLIYNQKETMEAKGESKMKFKDLLECMSKIMKEVQLIRVVTEVYGMQFSSEGYYSRWSSKEELLCKKIVDVYAKEGVLIVELE